jgi:hypothetical protein
MQTACYFFERAPLMNAEIEDAPFRGVPAGRPGTVTCKLLADFPSNDLAQGPAPLERRII